MSNDWLYHQLIIHSHLGVNDDYSELISVHCNSKTYRIYSPDPDEYIITIDIVQKVRELGGNIISYPSSWCMASREAILYGKKHGVDIMPHGKLFSILNATGE